MKKLGLFIILLTGVACTDLVSNYSNQSNDPLKTGADQKPEIQSLSSREPNSGGSSLYIDIQGNNLGGNGWQAKLKGYSNTIELVTESITRNAARVVVPASAKILAGAYQLVVANAYGESNASITADLPGFS